MILAQIVGTVVASRKEPELEGIRFHLVRSVDVDGKPVGAAIVAADAVGAGVGELVLVAAGSSARQTAVTKNRPVDHVIMAIIDQITVDDVVKYDKSGAQKNRT